MKNDNPASPKKPAAVDTAGPGFFSVVPQQNVVEGKTTEKTHLVIPRLVLPPSTGEIYEKEGHCGCRCC